MQTDGNGKAHKAEAKAAFRCSGGGEWGGGTTNTFYCREHATYFKLMLSVYNGNNLSDTVAFEPHPKLNQNAMGRPQTLGTVITSKKLGILGVTPPWRVAPQKVTRVT